VLRGAFWSICASLMGVTSTEELNTVRCEVTPVTTMASRFVCWFAAGAAAGGCAVP
jgi:hypothetical protein